MRVLRCVAAVAVLSLLPGCDFLKKPEEEPPPPAPAPAPTPTQMELTTTEPAKPGEIVRPQLEDRADGITGKAVTVAGAKARIQVPNDWTLVATSKPQVATSPTQQARLAITNVGPEAWSAQLPTAEGALGLASCTWQPTTPFSTGKDKIPVQAAADGLCKRGGVDAQAAYIATDDLFILGAWDKNTDMDPMFGSMRSLARLATGTATPNLIACCRALAQNAASQPPPQNGFMLQAAATCEAAARANNAAAVNAALRQFGMQCK